MKEFSAKSSSESLGSVRGEPSARAAGTWPMLGKTQKKRVRRCADGASKTSCRSFPVESKCAELDAMRLHISERAGSEPTTSGGCSRSHRRQAAGRGAYRSIGNSAVDVAAEVGRLTGTRGEACCVGGVGPSVAGAVLAISPTLPRSRRKVLEDVRKYGDAGAMDSSSDGENLCSRQKKQCAAHDSQLRDDNRVPSVWERADMSAVSSAFSYMLGRSEPPPFSELRVPR